MPHVAVPDPEETVLSTLNKDGTRRWLRPRCSPGQFLRWRRVVGYALILLFTLLPYLRIAGKPPILLDVPRREFTFFGTTFLPTDTLLLALLVLATFVVVFLVTALFGRVWCGWGCPQTVYMELIYRPIERFFEGRNYRTDGKAPADPLRRGLKYVVFLIVSVVLAHTFLAYFVGVETLFAWVQRSPFEHPTAFLVMAATTGLMMLDFCLLREQICTIMCPYGRLQSALLDRSSLIISYDVARGEPRGRLTRRARGDTTDLVTGTTARGDCVDCHLCVVTCPTGIDIRHGLQMECIGCAQCIDACDAVMTRIGKPRGLIRYSSEAAMESGRRRLLRPRVLVYPLILAIVLTLFGAAVARRAPIDLSFLRHRATPYTMPDEDHVATQVIVKITNRARVARTFSVTVPEAPQMTSSNLPLVLDAGATGTATLRLVLPRDRFERGRANIAVHVEDGADFARSYRHHVMGPLYAGAAP